MARFNEEDSAAVERMFKDAPRCFAEGEFKTWAGLYAEDAILQPQNAPTVVGRGDIEAFLCSLPFEEMTWSDVQVSGEGNMAYGTSTYWLRFSAEAGGIEDSGKQLVVFRRSPDEKEWKVVAVSFNSDLPLHTPTAATDSAT